MEKIGLIAGNKRFPILFAEAAKRNGCHIVAVAIKGDTSAALAKYVDKIHWLNLGDFGRIPEIFKKEGIDKVAMAGQVSPHRLFSKEVISNKEIKGLLEGIRDKRADTIFAAVAARLAEAGLELVSSSTFMDDFLPQKGALTAKEPDKALREDISFGLALAKEVAGLDIGQTVAVKEKAIVAVEALEGTDNVIRRASRICRGGFTLAKVSKPRQDVRFDIPVVGLNTVRNLIRAKAACLAIEAGKTLFLDRRESIRLADAKGLVIVAV